jgi:hypothetical protein
MEREGTRLLMHAAPVSTYASVAGGAVKDDSVGWNLG